ncbi:hypothetical protein RBSWK_01703 [Rhodopirellula baltica SWK14]|uniref:Uncharacterized protein n=1 Tax=Rhodopirellula baltica SWK14 TaxID=993516 RepID=L7CJ88_RHOBT|nr:hypothetical protein RBSWK_01703 [Rhodopirellula baltica SWK14]
MMRDRMTTEAHRQRVEGMFQILEWLVIVAGSFSRTLAAWESAFAGNPSDRG